MKSLNVETYEILRQHVYNNDTLLYTFDKSEETSHSYYLSSTENLLYIKKTTLYKSRNIETNQNFPLTNGSINQDYRLIIDVSNLYNSMEKLLNYIKLNNKILEKETTKTRSKI